MRSKRPLSHGWPDDDAEDRDHPLVMHYEFEPDWLDPVRPVLPRATRRQERAQGQLLAAAIDKARLRLPNISYSRRRAYYAARGKRYDAHPDLCRYDLIVPNVDLLAGAGLLQTKIAAADPTSGRQSVFRATPAAIEMLGPAPPPRAKRKLKSLIQLRNEDKLPIDYRDTDNTTRMLRHLLDINEMVESAAIEVPVDAGELRGDLLIFGDNAVNLGSTTLYRVFNVDFKTGGRFYGHFVQGLPKKVRARLTIEGEPVVEPDYKAHHPRILYELESLLLPDDPYDIHGWERNVVKVALLIMINAPSWQRARGAIMHRLGLTHDEARRLVHDIEHRHAPIAKYFHSGAGRWLQCYDSRMAERILLEAMRQGTQVLPIHDSFITPVSHGDRVRELMEMAFQTVIYGSRAAPPILMLQQELKPNSFHKGIESVSSSSPLPCLALSLSGSPALFGTDHRLTVLGRISVLDAWRRRAIHQETFADLIGISRPALANILARRFGASPQTAERITKVIATTPAFERQPFLPGIAA